MTRQMTEQEAREKLIELGEQSLRKEQAQHCPLCRLILLFAAFTACEVGFFLSKSGDFNKLYLLFLFVNAVVLVILGRVLLVQRKAIRGISETVYALEHGKGEHCLERLKKLGHTVTVTEPDCEIE